MVSKGSLHGEEEDDEFHFPFSNSLVWIWEMKKQEKKGRKTLGLEQESLLKESSKKKKKGEKGFLL